MLTSRPDSTSGSQEVNLSLEVSNIEATYQGRTLYLALFAPGSTCDSDPSSALYLTSQMVAADSCRLTIANVRAGSYTACGLIDADGNMAPGSGDKIGMRSLSLPGDAASTWSAVEWMTI